MEGWKEWHGDEDKTLLKLYEIVINAYHYGCQIPVTCEKCRFFIHRDNPNVSCVDMMAADYMLKHGVVVKEEDV